MSDIERMAREAGLEQQDYRRSGVWLANGEDLARFAALVRADALEQAAKLVDERARECVNDAFIATIIASHAAAIRAMQSAP